MDLASMRLIVRPGEGVVVTARFGQVRSSQQRFPVPAVAGPPLGLSHRDQQFLAAAVVREHAGGVEEFEGVGEVAPGLVVSQLGHGPEPGPGGVVDGPMGVGSGQRRPGPVVRQGGEVVVDMAAVHRLDRLGDLAVQRDSARRRDLLVERRPDKSVGEPVADLPGNLDHQPGGDLPVGQAAAE